jgi:hypothetical protein
MLLVSPSQKGFVWVFKGGEAPVGCRRLPPIQLRIPTKILNPTHRFCYRATFCYVALYSKSKGAHNGR